MYYLPFAKESIKRMTQSQNGRNTLKSYYQWKLCQFQVVLLFDLSSISANPACALPRQNLSRKNNGSGILIDIKQRQHSEKKALRFFVASHSAGRRQKKKKLAERSTESKTKTNFWD